MPALSERLRAGGVDPGLVAAALTQSRLRERARGKFGPFASRMLFTAEGLEQATRLEVAARHAQRFVGAGVERGRRPRLRHRRRRDGPGRSRPRGGRRRARRGDRRGGHGEPAALRGHAGAARGRHHHRPHRDRRRLPRPGPPHRHRRAGARPPAREPAAVVRARPGRPAAGRRGQGGAGDPARPGARTTPRRSGSRSTATSWRPGCGSAWSPASTCAARPSSCRTGGGTSAVVVDGTGTEAAPRGRSGGRLPARARRRGDPGRPGRARRAGGAGPAGRPDDRLRHLRLPRHRPAGAQLPGARRDAVRAQAAAHLPARPRRRRADDQEARHGGRAGPAAPAAAARPAARRPRWC